MKKEEIIKVMKNMSKEDKDMKSFYLWWMEVKEQNEPLFNKIMKKLEGMHFGHPAELAIFLKEWSKVLWV